MIVEVPLQLGAWPGRPTARDVQAALAKAYAGERFVEVASPDEAAAIKTLGPEGLNGTNRMRLYVFAAEAHGQARLVALLDNLGAGARGGGGAEYEPLRCRGAHRKTPDSRSGPAIQSSQFERNKEQPRHVLRIDAPVCRSLKASHETFPDRPHSSRGPSRRRRPWSL